MSGDFDESEPTAYERAHMREITPEERAKEAALYAMIDPLIQGQLSRGPVLTGLGATFLFPWEVALAPSDKTISSLWAHTRESNQSFPLRDRHG